MSQATWSVKALTKPLVKSAGLMGFASADQLHSDLTQYTCKSVQSQRTGKQFFGSALDMQLLFQEPEKFRDHKLSRFSLWDSRLVRAWRSLYPKLRERVQIFG